MMSVARSKGAKLALRVRGFKSGIIYVLLGLSLLIIYSMVLGGVSNALNVLWQHLLGDFEQLEVHLFIVGIVLVAYGSLKLIVSRTGSRSGVSKSEA